ncbi:hypothetical protein E4T56_gene11826 [Termitomyces sp. T112]|nr:hypothetical protein E4T56_gene11826 [Termitomyces sp. T112]
MEIWASQTTSQWLAQAFAANSVPQAFQDIMPSYLHMFEDVEADSSDLATGAILSQQSPEDGKWYLVAFYFKSLKAVEQNYKIDDKEMLAIIQLFEEWWHFLKGAWHKFEAWWSLYLANFDFLLHCKPSQSMGKPDTLSWRVNHGMGKWENNSNIMLLCSELFTIQAMEGLAIRGAEVDILWSIQWGNQNGQQEELIMQAAWMLKLGHITSAKLVQRDKWALWNVILTFRDCIYMPNIPELHPKIMEQHYDSCIAGHPKQWKILELVLWNYWWP